ncbi:MAG TPA: extracellular solute-binding protein [Clostridiaceae bacterium]|nr:extracellular solute-binding protein [Clostridiaceae bacterium]
MGLFIGCDKSTSADNPNPAKPDAKYDFNGRILDVLFMVGGQGQMADPIVAKLKEVYPGLNVNVVYDHNAHEIMRNRVMAGNPPDIFDLNQGFYDYYGAISEGICKPLDFLYPLKTIDGTKTLKDVMDFNAIQKGYLNGKYYLMADSIYTSGLWYDAKLLRDNNLNPPTTWNEFVEVCEKLKQKGIYGLSWSGRWAGEYAMNYFFYPMVASLDYDTFIAIENLEDDAWDRPAVREVMNRLKMMVDKGYFDVKASGMDASEIQMEFIKRTFAFYPCGSWLEAEMAGNWPADFELTYLPFSGVSDKNGTNYTLLASVVSGISSKTKNEDIVGEYYRYFLSDYDTTAKVVSTSLNGLPLKGFSEQFGHLLPKSVQGTWEAISAGNMPLIQMASSWYPEHLILSGDSITAFVNGDITADEFAKRMNEFNKATKADSSIVKYTREKKS